MRLATNLVVAFAWCSMHVASEIVSRCWKHGEQKPLLFTAYLGWSGRGRLFLLGAALLGGGLFFPGVRYWFPRLVNL